MRPTVFLRGNCAPPALILHLRNGQFLTGLGKTLCNYPHICEKKPFVVLIPEAFSSSFSLCYNPEAEGEPGEQKAGSIMIETILHNLAAHLENKLLLRRVVKSLDAAALRDCLEEILCHVDIHIAECCFKEADILLRLGKRLAYALRRRAVSENHFDKYSERFMRKRCQWLEAQGLYIHSAKHWEIACRKYQKLPKKERDDSILAALCLDAALAYAGAGKTSQALRLTRKANKLFGNQNDQPNALAARFNEASLLYDEGKYSDSDLTCVSIMFALATPETQSSRKISFSDPALAAKTLLQMANNSEISGETEDSSRLYGQALKMYYHTADYKKQAEITYRIGWLLKKSDRFETALQYLKASFIIRMLTERKRALLRQAYLKARLFWSLGLPHRAQRGFVIALFLAEQLNDSTYLTLTRYGFYKAGQGLGINLRSAMTATALEAHKPWTMVNIPGGFRRYASDGYALPAYPTKKNNNMSFKDKRSLINLINDLTFCAGAADSAEAPYYRAQQRAFRIY